MRGLLFCKHWRYTIRQRLIYTAYMIFPETLVTAIAWPTEPGLN